MRDEEFELHVALARTTEGSEARQLWRQTESVARELAQLDSLVADWDGTYPPHTHLTDRVQAVEDHLAVIEGRLAALSASRDER
jgi:hypothetical protein